MPVSEKPHTKTIELRISVPAWKLPPQIHAVIARFNTLSRRQKFFSIGALLLIFCCSLFFVTNQLQPSSKAGGIRADDTDTRRFPTDIARAPDYPTLFPNGKTIEALGGWTRVSPPKSNPVFAYTDTIAGKPINVSQQPLPEEFKEDTDTQIEQLATGYGALERIKVADITLFIGTSAKGPQSVIFSKNNTLILIKSTTPHSQDEWVSYVSSLQ